MLRPSGSARRRGDPGASARLRAGGGAAKLRGVTFDCSSCGACCCNPDENRAEGFRDYVEVQRGSRLLLRLRILGRYTVANERGERHMKLVGAEQRCAALETLVAQVRARLPEVHVRIRTRLDERLAELKAQVDLPRMAEHASGMLRSALDAFTASDAAAARAAYEKLLASDVNYVMLATPPLEAA